MLMPTVVALLLLKLLFCGLVLLAPRYVRKS